MVKKTAKRKKVSTPLTAYCVLKPLMAAHDDVEALYCIFLSNGQRVKSIDKMFSGTIDEATIFPREIIKRLIEVKASSVIMAHNHPDGDPKPSDKDKSVTYKMNIALESVGAKLLDHLIIAGDYFYSFSEETKIL